MPRDPSTKSKISSFAAPTEEDLAAFEALPEEEKRLLIEAEIEKGLTGEARKVTAEDIVAAAAACRARKALL
jgi:predicted nucleic acid-binding protein